MTFLLMPRIEGAEAGNARLLLPLHCSSLDEIEQAILCPAAGESSPGAHRGIERTIA